MSIMWETQWHKQLPFGDGFDRVIFGDDLLLGLPTLFQLSIVAVRTASLTPINYYYCSPGFVLLKKNN